MYVHRTLSAPIYAFKEWNRERGAEPRLLNILQVAYTMYSNCISPPHRCTVHTIVKRDKFAKNQPRTPPPPPPHSHFWSIYARCSVSHRNIKLFALISISLICTWIIQTAHIWNWCYICFYVYIVSKRAILFPFKIYRNMLTSICEGSASRMWHLHMIFFSTAVLNACAG